MPFRHPLGSFTVRLYNKQRILTSLMVMREMESQDKKDEII